MAIDADVIFDSNGAAMTSGITHAPGTADIGFANPGHYKVTFTMATHEPNQMALFVNGARVLGSVYGSGAGTQPSNGQVIVAIAASDVLTLRNHTSAAAVTLQTPAGGTQQNANASVAIEKLN